MRLAIISDIHNNEINLKKVLDYCGREKIERIICCGDLGSPETLKFLNNNFPGKIYLSFGNVERDNINIQAYNHINIYTGPGELEIDNKKVAFVHYPDEAKKLAGSGKYTHVFFGHTHKPWTEKFGNCTMLNPGNVAGDIYPPTFAVWNTDEDKFELIRIHDLK